MKMNNCATPSPSPLPLKKTFDHLPISSCFRTSLIYLLTSPRNVSCDISTLDDCRFWSGHVTFIYERKPTERFYSYPHHSPVLTLISSPRFTPVSSSHFTHMLCRFLQLLSFQLLSTVHSLVCFAISRIAKALANVIAFACFACCLFYQTLSSNSPTIPTRQ